MKNNNTLLSFLAADDAIIKSVKDNKNNEKIFIFLGTWSNQIKLPVLIR